MLDQYIDNLKDDIVKEICNLVNIPSVSEETENPEIPFGEGCKNALEYILNLGKQLGFKTKNIDNYCGYIEFGEGVIKKIENKRLYIRFSGGMKMMTFPDAFTKGFIESEYDDFLDNLRERVSLSRRTRAVIEALNRVRTELEELRI